tara:strand:+ start:180 stop:302 length:123 start_codon:yes stop_codon:yes gene_type:complete
VRVQDAHLVVEMQEEMVVFQLFQQLHLPVVEVDQDIVMQL